MAIDYLDSSALLRRYVAEPGSELVRDLFGGPRTARIATSVISGPEVASALARRQRDGTIDTATAHDLWRYFIRHRADQYTVIDLGPAIVALAETIVQSEPLRAADALHVASARWLVDRSSRSELVFWTADQRQAAGAHSVGLAVQLLG
ncbi:MAG: type II toxin-antitoxin system VapC family toxin [Chloroflexi bacterium]|nr:type II toxin-antitoxin system VapC family toxin [Chloroflexota bacterium]